MLPKLIRSTNFASISAVNKPNYSLQLTSIQQMSSDKSMTEKAKDMAGAAKEKVADVRY